MAASAIPPGVVDPTKPSKYPVILSDALLGKSPKEILTAIRYNHRPALSSDTAPSAAKLKAVPSIDNSYDLTYTDDGGRYAYNGNRTSKENQYVLVFDPERKAFVLHRLDSTFNMNLTRTPSNNDAESLKEEYPHVDSSTRASADKKGAGKAGGKAGGKGKNAAKSAGMVQSKRGPATTSAASAAPASTPRAKAEPPKEKEAEPSKPKRSRSPADSEEEYSDDDGGLLVEYPDPQPPSHHPIPATKEASPFPTTIRRFSEFMANQAGSGGESDEDADAEYDEDDLLIEDDAGDSSTGDGFKLPSPVGRQNLTQVHEVDEEEPPEDEELMAMLEQEMGEGEGMEVDSESEVSEED